MSDKNNSAQPYTGVRGGETKPGGEREILIIKSAVPSLQSPHTMFCSSFGLFQFTNDSANQLLSAEAFLARKQSSIYKTEFKR